MLRAVVEVNTGLNFLILLIGKLTVIFLDAQLKAAVLQELQVQLCPMCMSKANVVAISSELLFRQSGLQYSSCSSSS